MGQKKAPKHLSREAKKQWDKLLYEYEIADEAGLFLLQTGLEAFDRMREAQAKIKKEGMQVADRFGQMKAHPLITVERDARSAMLQAVKGLNLDIEPLQERVGKPNGR